MVLYDFAHNSVPKMLMELNVRNTINMAGAQSWRKANEDTEKKTMRFCLLGDDS